MKSTVAHRRYLSISAALLLAAGGAVAQPGSSGMPLLTLSATARDVGMGHILALADGPGAVQGNPAGVQELEPPPFAALLFTHQVWIEDSKTEFLGATFPIGAEQKQTLGLSLLTQSIPDIEIRTQPGPPEGTFTSRDLAIGLTYARFIGDDIRIGITGRFLYQKILINEATGVSFDAGIRTPLLVEGLEIGASVLNLGNMTVLQNQRTTLPALVRAGAGYALLRDGDIEARVQGDVVRNIPDKQFYGGIGGEVWFQRMVALRLGDELGSEGRGFAAGVGIRYSVFFVDYAYANLKQDLGTTHTFTFSMEF